MTRSANLRPFRRLAGLAVLSGLLAASASALTINPTFGTTFGTPFSAADMACINSVITLYQNTFNDPITVNITVNNMNSGLGQSQTSFYETNYGDIHTALINDATSTDDAAALVQLTASAPLNDATNAFFSKANAHALGFTGLGAEQDSVIGLNAGICFNQHTAAGASANPSKYDLFGVFCHELDEALGTVSGVGGGELSTADFYRYNGTAGGTLSGRSFTTSTTVHAWFSINGSTALDEYNQFQHQPGDYGDWVVHNPGQVQDYAGTPGQLHDPNVELRLLDVVGYNRTAAPEPGTWAAMGIGALVLFRRRRKA